MRTLGTYKGWDGVAHYVHIVPIPNGSDSMYFHCMGNKDREREIDWAMPTRADAYTTCLWCACDAQK